MYFIKTKSLAVGVFVDIVCTIYVHAYVTAL